MALLDAHSSVEDRATGVEEVGVVLARHEAEPTTRGHGRAQVLASHAIGEALLVKRTDRVACVTHASAAVAAVLVEAVATASARDKLAIRGVSHGVAEEVVPGDLAIFRPVGSLDRADPVHGRLARVQRRVPLGELRA